MFLRDVFYELVGSQFEIKSFHRCNDVISAMARCEFLIYIQIFLFFFFTTCICRCRTSKEGNLESPEMDPLVGEYWSNGNHHGVMKFEFSFVGSF